MHESYRRSINRVDLPPSKRISDLDVKVRTIRNAAKDGDRLLRIEDHSNERIVGRRFWRGRLSLSDFGRGATSRWREKRSLHPVRKAVLVDRYQRVSKGRGRKLVGRRRPFKSWETLIRSGADSIR